MTFYLESSHISHSLSYTISFCLYSTLSFWFYPSWLNFWYFCFSVFYRIYKYGLLAYWPSSLVSLAFFVIGKNYLLHKKIYKCCKECRNVSRNVINHTLLIHSYFPSCGIFCTLQNFQKVFIIRCLLLCINSWLITCFLVMIEQIWVNQKTKVISHYWT